MKTLDRKKLLQEIGEKGVEIENINDLMRIDKRHKDLVPILVKHLREIDDESDKEFLVRCLGVKGFTQASRPLIQEFYDASKPSYKWAIGNTLSMIQDREVVTDLVKIVQEKKHGTARRMIVSGLGIYRTEESVKKVLIELLNDDDVFGHALSAMAKMGDEKLRRYIEPFTNHETTWVRNKAKKAIEKFAKQANTKS